MRVPIDLPPAGQRRFDVVGLGLNTTDVIVVVAQYPEADTKGPIRRLIHTPGGQAATAMATCARLGWAARYIGRFGADANAAEGRRSLECEGVDLHAAPSVEGASNALSIIIVDERTGARTVLWSRDPGLSIGADDVSRDTVCAGRVLLVDCHETAAATAAARFARSAGVPTVIDVERVRPGIDDLLRNIDVIITAQDFPTALTGIGDQGKALHALDQTYRPALSCVTLGSEGSLALINGSEVHTRAFRVPVVDTTGAGDVFRGGFIAGWLRGAGRAEAEDILTYANAVAALKCRCHGARAGIPRPDDVETLVEGGEAPPV